tara:strand:- start:1007 stop:1483 length:477 start_codon:yes stop_codon:yes gene_type:complete
LATIVLISGCSILGPKEIEVVSKPVQLEIIQPTLPREVSLNTPRWYVVSEARIANPCKKVEQEDGSMKRPKACDLEDRENPDWPEGYTYLDRFLDEMKAQNNGDVVFVATTIGDYKQMTVNNQEIRRYIRELGEVVVYYRNVTMPNGDKAVGVEIEKN